MKGAVRIFRWFTLAALVGSTALAGTAFCDERDVQIVSVDFETNVIELFNFDSIAHDLDGWQFCTHDSTLSFQYSSSSGLNGTTVGAGESLFIHFDSDAPAEPGRIDLPAGNWATPLDRGPYSIGFYFPPVSFGNGNTLADHVQWSINGGHNNTAASRSGEAVAGGVWTATTAWVSTAAESPGITLLAESEGEELHGPDDYAILPEPGDAALRIAALLCVATVARRRRSRARIR